ncbi:DUF805 domain-containing protein [Novosphingobium lindaniclasticum]
MMASYMRGIGATLRASFDFTGKASRGELWAYLLAASMIAALLSTVISWFVNDRSAGVAALAIGLACAVPAPALAIRRLHDFGRSGWWSAALVIGGLRALLLEGLQIAFGWNVRSAVENIVSWVDWAIFPAFGLVYLALLAWPGKRTGPARPVGGAA